MASRGSDRAGHAVFTSALRAAAPGEPVEVQKTQLRRLPKSYEETFLGTPPRLAQSGAHRQFRGPYRRHVYEKRNTWVVHRDAYDPRRDPLEHLLVDAPEWGAGLLAFSLVGMSAARSSRERALALGAEPREAAGVGLVDGVVAGCLAGLGAFAAVKLIKGVLES